MSIVEIAMGGRKVTTTQTTPKIDKNGDAYIEVTEIAVYKHDPGAAIGAPSTSSAR